MASGAGWAMATEQAGRGRRRDGHPEATAVRAAT